MVRLVAFGHKAVAWASIFVMVLISVGVNILPAKATGEPTFEIQYYHDFDLASEASPILKAGTYYLKITADEDLTGTPTINIDAEGMANDVTDGTTSSVSTTIFQYTRVIAYDPLAIGTTQEDISITGTDTQANTANNADPTNEDSQAAYTDTTTPINENSVFGESTFDHGSHTIAINSSDEITNGVWFAPIDTTDFTAGNTMTVAASGIATSILAPATAGTYYLYVIDEAGNISEPTTATLTVDNTAPTGSIRINNNAAYTKTNAVTLKLSATDTGGSGVFQMRFSNNNSAWSAWQNYATSKTWNLTSSYGASTSQGTKRVYAQFSDYAGNIISYNDTIKYDKKVPTSTIKINKGAKATHTPFVTLNLVGRDTGGVGVQYMRFSNNGLKWTTWRTYSTHFRRWNMASSTYGGSKHKGTKKVYVQFKDRAGNISRAKYDRISYQDNKYIIIDLSRQKLYAYNNKARVKSFLISSGKWGTPTPKGKFRIFAKTRSQLMDGPSYYLPNVQWISWFISGGYSIHGTYWHNNFGHPMSHGCINATNKDAKWIYKWAPMGTKVTVRS